MKKILDNIGFYDFWGVFAPGMVVLTLGLLPYHNVVHDYVTKEFKFEAATGIALFVLLSYIAGLICHAMSILFVDFKFSAFNIDKATTNVCVRFAPWRKKYIIENNVINKLLNAPGFEHCYNHVIYNKLDERVNKMHSIYGMSRGIATGCFVNLIISILVWILVFKEFSLQMLFVVLGFAFLYVLFYTRAKKYFYRWIEWVFVEYSLHSSTNNKEGE